MYVSGGCGEKAQVITTDIPCAECPELDGSHEESNTRMVLHAIYAAQQGAQTVVVNSLDTDVLVLLIHHRPDIPANEIYFATV